MPYCTSCGSEIPDGQGNSCSMCYGDVAWGTDGYYLEFMEAARQEEIARLEQRQREEEEEYRRLAESEHGQNSLDANV